MLGSVDRQMKNLMLVNNGEKIVYPSSDRVTINIGQSGCDPSHIAS